MSKLALDIDIHAHSGPLRADAIVCVDPTETESLPDGEGLLSVGIHPWNADKASAEIRLRLEQWLDDVRVKAVGEIGFDRLRGPEMAVQREVFDWQAKLAASHNKPVVIHCVRAYDILLQCAKSRPREEQWIVHGFRGNPILAEQLLTACIDLSFGEKYNRESYAVTPPERRYRESDK